MNNPSKAPLAVVTVTYSPGEYLDAFASSIPEATTRDVLLVMADNGSVDGSPEAAERRYQWAEFLPTGGNIGYGAAINCAVRSLKPRVERGEVDGEFFLISNPDVLFSPGSIDALIDAASRHPGAASFGPYIKEEDGSAYPSARAVPTLGNGIGHALLSGVWPSNPWTRAYKADQDMTVEHEAGWLSGSCLLVRWDAFEAIGGFDERYFMYMEDVDLGDRFGRAGWSNVFVPSSVIEHAKGHVAGEHPELMLPAHHESAYRFQADRYPAVWHFPLRAALWLGLKCRATLAVASARLRRTLRRN